MSSNQLFLLMLRVFDSADQRKIEEPSDLALQNYLLKRMKNQNQEKVQPFVDPFRIIYNCRNKKNDRQRPRRKVSACQRHRPVPEFTMRTRKMTAEIELQHQLFYEVHLENEEEANNSHEEQPVLQQEGEFFLKNEDHLQNGIPLSHDYDNDIFLHLSENSQFSTYSKLQRALCGFNLGEAMDQE